MRIITFHGESEAHLRSFVGTTAVDLATFRQNEHVTIAQADLSHEFLHLNQVRFRDEFLLR